MRCLTAVLLERDRANFVDLTDQQVEQQRFERLKQQHIEYHPGSQESETISESKFQINAQTVNMQVVETTAGGDAIIHKDASNPQVAEALNTLLELLQELQDKHPDVVPDRAEDIVTAELVELETKQPQRWQRFRQLWQRLPQVLRNREQLLQASQSALAQVATDLSDNIFLNAVVAFLEGLSSDADS